MLFKKLAFYCLIFCCSITVNAQKVDEIIAKNIAFTGGEHQWKTVKTIVSSGTYNYGGLEFEFESFSKRPNLYKYIVSSNGKYFAQAFDGTEGWKIDGFKDETIKIILSGKPALALANEADAELESSLINYKIKGNNAILEGKDTVENTICFKVKFIRNSGDTETCYFSTENFSLIKKQALSKNEELDNSMIDIYYADYKMVKGVKIPFQTMIKIKDQIILTIAVKKVQLNTPIPDKDFRP